MEEELKEKAKNLEDAIESHADVKEIMELSQNIDDSISKFLAESLKK